MVSAYNIAWLSGATSKDHDDICALTVFIELIPAGLTQHDGGQGSDYEETHVDKQA